MVPPAEITGARPAQATVQGPGARRRPGRRPRRSLASIRSWPSSTGPGPSAAFARAVELDPMDVDARVFQAVFDFCYVQQANDEAVAQIRARARAGSAERQRLGTDSPSSCRGPARPMRPPSRPASAIELDPDRVLPAVDAAPGPDARLRSRRSHRGGPADAGPIRAAPLGADGPGLRQRGGRAAGHGRGPLRRAGGTRRW